MLALAHGVHRQAEAADDRRAVARAGADDRRAAARHRARDPRAAARPIVLVEQSVNVALTRRRAGRVHGEGRGAVRGPDRRAARARRHPALGLPRGRRRRRRGGSRGASTRARRAKRERHGGRPCCSRPRASRSASAASPPSTTSISSVHRGRDPRPHRAERRGQDDDVRPASPGSSTPTAGASCSTASTSPTWRPDAGRAMGLGRSFQDARLFPSLTVAENIARRARAAPRGARPARRGAAPPGVREPEDDVACDGRASSSS